MFSDGTAVTLNADMAVSTSFGSIPGIFLAPLKLQGLNIDGGALMEALNSRDDDCDASYGWDFHLDSVEKSKDVTTVNFDIEYGHYTKGHRIIVKNDKSFELKLEDPFWGCGADKELIPIIKKYLSTI